MERLTLAKITKNWAEAQMLKFGVSIHHFYLKSKLEKLAKKLVHTSNGIVLFFEDRSCLKVYDDGAMQLSHRS